MNRNHLERLGRNEALFREVNERITELGERLEEDRLDIVCECADVECAARIELPYLEYEQAREDEATFIVVDGHEDRSTQRVVQRGNRYVFVEALGDAATVAAETDPR